MRNSKNVESYFIEKFENGIYHVLFNTTERWISYHSYNDEMYSFGLRDEGYSQLEYEESIQEIPKFLPESQSFVPTVVQNKDQISFYFIPFSLHKSREIIHTYNCNENK